MALIYVSEQTVSNLQALASLLGFAKTAHVVRHLVDKAVKEHLPVNSAPAEPEPLVDYAVGPLSLYINAEHAGKLRKLTGRKQPAPLRNALYRMIDDAYKAKFGTEGYRPAPETLRFNAPTKA